MAQPNKYSITRWEKGARPSRGPDELAGEEPLEIRVQNRAVSVTMRTPGHDVELAAGFLLTEGLIKSASDILRIEPCGHSREGNVVNAFLAPSVTVDFARLTRHVFTASSCGLCGKASIDALRQEFGPAQSNMTIDAEVLLGLPDKMRQSQAAFDRTGGLHAAGVFDVQGSLLVSHEDVGRHNGVDKVLGHALLHNLLPLSNHVLLVSGRASFEIMQKALAGGIAMVASVSAPSSLAVDFALEAEQTLVGFLRPGRMNVYANEHRVRFSTG